MFKIYCSKKSYGCLTIQKQAAHQLKRCICKLQYSRKMPEITLNEMVEVLEVVSSFNCTELCFGNLSCFSNKVHILDLKHMVGYLCY